VTLQLDVGTAATMKVMAIGLKAAWYLPRIWQSGWGVHVVGGREETSAVDHVVGTGS
jgi:hypothetical protein